MTDHQAQEERLQELEARAGDMDQVAEDKHGRDTDDELRNEFGFEDVDEPADNLVEVAALAAFDEDDASRKEVIDDRIMELRDAVDAEKPLSDEALDELARLLDERPKHLGIDEEDHYSA